MQTNNLTTERVILLLFLAALAIIILPYLTVLLTGVMENVVASLSEVR